MAEIPELITYSAETIRPFEGDRIGEVILGDGFAYVPGVAPLTEELAASDADYVLFGIEEDIGVLGNYGRSGAARAWNVALHRLINVQRNPYNRVGKAILLGHLEFPDIMDTVHGSACPKPEELGPFVEHIDGVVSRLVEMIIASGKMPIVIGGGHNNAYGMLKGTSLGLGKPVNALNIDAHADMRPRDYRHSGNGFSYALNEGFLDRYFVFGLHENYISEAIYDKIKRRPEQVRYNTYEEIRVRDEKDFETEAKAALDFVGAGDFGLEIDVDAMEFMPSSAFTPSGFSVQQVRRLVYLFGRHPKMRYIHICEASPQEGSTYDTIAVGKLISYLITDILREI